MHRNPFRWLLPAACVVAVSAAPAQNPPRPSAESNPLEARATVPAVVYRSALSDYRRLSDDKPVPWPEANDSVGRIGGWRAYAREASAPKAAGSAPPAPRTPPPAAADKPQPMPSPHGGQEMN
jgi:hypothetical protein